MPWSKNEAGVDEFRLVLNVPSAESLRPANGNTPGPLTLTIDVHTAHLIDQRIHERADLTRIGAQDASRLPVVRGHHVFERVLDVYERHPGNNRAELFLTINFHSLADGIDHRRVEERHRECADALVDD